jgi:hypothetical protein
LAPVFCDKSFKNVGFLPIPCVVTSDKIKRGKKKREGRERERGRGRKKKHTDNRFPAILFEKLQFPLCHVGFVES